jgi:tRNA threonylcarbamoyladenosine biosynthesis protein TsaE
VRLYHVDLYRISDVAEAWSLGLDELLGDERALCIVEWAEHAHPLMPSDHLWIRLEFADQTRRTVYFTAQGERHATLLQEFRQVAFGA